MMRSAQKVCIRCNNLAKMFNYSAASDDVKIEKFQAFFETFMNLHSVKSTRDAISITKYK